MTALEGVVQLDRSGPPPRVVYDTEPIQVIDVRWEDIEGCFLMRVGLDAVAHALGVQSGSIIVEVLIVRHRGPFIRVPGEDAFWPRVEIYGLSLESLPAIAQRDVRARRPQLQLGIPSQTERGSDGFTTRRKGRKP